MTTYSVLTDDEKDDIIVNFTRAQERDHYCHSINLERYDEMLKTLPTGDFRNDIEKRKADTQSRIAEVEKILEATAAQMPDAARIEAAMQRIKTAESVK